ncbi:MAG: hypothetical protein KDD66_00530 [Bdellovibrionales bacterium]|nr:hypothetical protein [Bdellovibrionales bacterium]
MKQTTLTIIGGASAYVPGLVQAMIARAKQLNLKAVRLYDLDQQRLEVVARLCNKMAELAEPHFPVTAEPSLSLAIKDADIVLNSSRPGGLACRRIDETLPLDFDVPGQETVGPGGFFFALRSIPAALKLTRKMKQLAPNALLLNYTNPSNIVTQAIVDSGFDQVIGLCDQAYEDLEALSSAMNCKMEPLAFNCLGLNHASVYSSIEFNGEPIEVPRAHLDAPDFMDQDHRLRFEICQTWAKEHDGLWPNSYLTYYLQPEAFVKLSKEVGPRADVILKSIPRYYEHFKEESEKRSPELKFFRGSTGFGDLAVHVLQALAGGLPANLVLNLRNNNATSFFDKDTVIETSAEIYGTDVRSTCGQAILPDDLRSLLRQLEEYQRATAAAATAPSNKLLTEALAANPLVSSSEIAAKMIHSASEKYGSAIDSFNES